MSSEPARLLRSEQIPWASVSSRLQGIGAKPMPDRSSSIMHIYHSPSLGAWIGVQKRGDWAHIGYFSSCPCSGTIIQ